MDRMIVELYKDFKVNDGGHICYLYNNESNYMTNVVSFIVTGIRNGDYILLLENDRNILQIKEMLQNELSEKELTYLLFINNFDFYYSYGNFHPHTIVNHFVENIEPHLQKGASICTWGLVEWREDKEIHKNIAEYEEQIHKIVNEKGIVSVCAYDASRTSDSLKKVLHNCHGVLMSDEKVINL
ncbi:MEDS domain-containing protein [Mesobacillus foraminis]|uniref:DcmR-like sensory protein n=1 Tax=Mesobacillus foraminis TaxID=279826 RepID=A0A4R2BKG9_9BACI|nr:MEDS domain-containing protein [Mesobacillus foraminis]TCN26504.1 DcmR-like sensory protein [Mesobacillus foraminis]